MKHQTIAHSATILVALFLVAASAGAAPVANTLTREEDRSQAIGRQTAEIAAALDGIIEQLRQNRLMTVDESADFSAAQQGMDDIARREVGEVIASLIAARKALETAQQRLRLDETIDAQQALIQHLTEELIRIQYRSQLRRLLEEMQAIVGNQRQAVRTTQNGAIEMAATDSDELSDEIHDRMVVAQDGVWHDWILVSEQVRVMVDRFRALPFIETLQEFRTRAAELPIERLLAETRNYLREKQFGRAVEAQRELSAHFLVLLKMLQKVGLSPAEQRSALDDLIEKTEQALRDQQDIRQRTDALGDEMTEPLRQELARSEDSLANFVDGLAEEADQAMPAEANTAQPPSASEQDSQAGTSSDPSESTPADNENPWAQNEPAAAPDSDYQPASPAAQSLTSAADRMEQARDELTAGQTQAATSSQNQAANDLAQALEQLRDAIAQANRDSQLAQLAEMLREQNAVLNELGEIIEEQEGLIARTHGAMESPPAPGESTSTNEQAASPPDAGQTTGEQNPATEAGQPDEPLQPGEAAPPGTEPGEEPGEAGTEPPQPATGPAAPADPARLAGEQMDLADRTEEFTQNMAGLPATESLADAITNMDQAATQLERPAPGEALPHQNEAVRSLREAERQIATALANALGADQPLEWLDHMGNLDEMISDIEEMADTAANMPPAPAPEMAMQADEIGQELGSMAGQPPTGPAMAAQMQEGGQMMGMASNQLNQGQTGPASQTMNETAEGLRNLRAQMAAQMAMGLQQAMSGQPGQQGQAMSGQQLAAAAANQSSQQPATQPGRGGRGEGMRGEGPTNFQPGQVLEHELESGDWSHLPPREREEILQALKERYPARYERDLIRYYRNLSRLEAER